LNYLAVTSQHCLAVGFFRIGAWPKQYKGRRQYKNYGDEHEAKEQKKYPGKIKHVR